MDSLSVITVGIDPNISIGPLTIAWHGLMTAVGLAVGTVLAVRYGRRRGLDPDTLINLAVLVGIAGIAGARVFYLAVNKPVALLQPGEWLGTNGFAFYGAMIFGTLAVGIYLRRHALRLRYLDALAWGFPLGLAVGRVGDLMNGEHYGPVSDAPWAVRNTHPDADVPSTLVAYHSGGLYEIVLGLAVFAVVWTLRHRLGQPGRLLIAAVGLYGLGRFLMFFYRADSSDAVLGLVEAQWTSLGLILVAALGWVWLRHRPTTTTESSAAPAPLASGGS